MQGEGDECGETAISFSTLTHPFPLHKGFTSASPRGRGDVLITQQRLSAAPAPPGTAQGSFQLFKGDQVKGKAEASQGTLAWVPSSW